MLKTIVGKVSMKSGVGLAILCGLLCNSGCETLGPIFGVIASAVPKDVDAAYKGLPDQKVVILVWTEDKIRLDYPGLSQSVAAELQNKLIVEQKKDAPEQLKGTSFPFSSELVSEYQDQHPELENETLEATASKLAADRVIYISVKDFATKSEAMELYKGHIVADLKVVEISPDGKAKVAYQESDIDATFPKDCPKEGMPAGTDERMSSGTVDLFTTAVAQRFYRHNEDRN